jgi:hypothetical protein
MASLIENKADCKARNDDGMTALDLFKVFTGTEFTLSVGMA